MGWTIGKRRGDIAPFAWALAASRVAGPLQTGSARMDSHRKALASYDPKIERAIAGEERRQVDGVEMIPSEN